MRTERQDSSRPVTIKDIAAHCGVGKSIVSYALRGETHRMRPETLARILEAADALGYDPHAYEAARRMVAQRTNQPQTNHLVAVYFPTQALQGSRYYAQLLVGVVEALNAAGFSVLLESLADTPPDLPPLLRRGDVDGVIGVLSPIINTQMLQMLRSTPAFRNRPIASMLFATPDTLSVLADDEAGGYAAAHHLLALGHRHLLLLTLPGCLPVPVSTPVPPDCRWHPAINRLRGIQRAYAEAGISLDTHLHTIDMPLGWIDPDLLPAHGMVSWAAPPAGIAMPALPDYLRAHPQITAVLAYNDISAFQAWATLHAAGMRIPEDISLIGFDDTTPIYDASVVNLLTTVRVPLQAIGRTTAELVIQRINGADTPDEVVLPTELVVRHSTTPSPHTGV